MSSARADKERRERLPNFAVQGLLEIMAAADIARECDLAGAVGRAEYHFDDVTLAYLSGVEERLFKIRDIAKSTLEGKSLELIEQEAEMELQKAGEL